MSPRPQPDEQPINRAAATLRHASDDEALELDNQDDVHFPQINTSPNPRHGPLRRRLAQLWSRHISMAVPHVACRDHLANERTFLGYLRTSQIFSMTGIFIAQLLRLQHSLAPDPMFGFHIVSVPLSAICQIMAILLLVIGLLRYFKLQSTMARGKAITGGWEIYCVGGLSLAILLSLFVIVLAIVIKEG